MCTPLQAQNSSEVTSDRTREGTQNNTSIGKRTIENAKTAVSFAVDALSFVAEATENVPYLGAISKALTAFKEVLDEVSVCKDDCKATINEAEDFRDLILKFEGKPVQFSDGDDGRLKEAFKDLTSTLLDCLQTLREQRADSKSRRDRFRLLFKRDEVQASVTNCRNKIRVAKGKFDTTVALDTNSIVRDLRQQSRRDNAPHANVPAAELVWSLRSPPPIFYGREKEVEHAVSLIVHQAPARVAILGLGGIGKTSIALSVLHHPEVKALYQDHRCFVSCEAMTTADGVVRVLSEALGLIIEKGASAQAIERRLFSSLKSLSGIICLDNFETPWDADTATAEALLTEIAALPHVALLITSRVTDTPLFGWSSPALDPIKPFSIEAALQTWDTICSRHDDYAVQLVEAVDRVPLAVTLLARLARTETSKVVWARWEMERTELIRSNGTEHRLNNLGVSIELSLRALKSQDAIDVLSILCIFPNGFPEHQITTLGDALKDSLSANRHITTLRQFSLVYAEIQKWSYGEHYVCVLSPIRHHMQQHHVSDELFLKLADILLQDRDLLFFYERDAMTMFGMHRPGPCRDYCLEFVISHPRSSYDIGVLSQALEKARALEPRIQSELLRQLGVLLRILTRDFEKSRSFLSEAIEIDERLGYRSALFEDWVEWLYTFIHEFEGREGECADLDEIQNIVHKTWELGRNENQEWNRDFDTYTNLGRAQHLVNKGRRKRNLPVLHRSGLCTDNASTEFLHANPSGEDHKACYYRLLESSAPPWDLSLILQIHRELGHGKSREQEDNVQGSEETDSEDSEDVAEGAKEDNEEASSDEADGEQRAEES